MSKQLVERNKIITERILNGEKYTVLAKEYGVSKQRIRQYANLAKVDRWADKRARKNKFVELFNNDVENGLTINEIIKKYSLSRREVLYIYRYATGKSLIQIARQKRNSTIVNKFVSGDTANKILIDKDKTLFNPLHLATQSSIYSVNTSRGVKRYPQVGNRHRGGTSQNKKIINLIVNRRDKGWTCERIREELIRRGHKTVTGCEFKAANVLQLYNYAKDKLGK